MFGWFRKKPKTPPPEKYWVGSVQLGWYNEDPHQIVHETIINLFEDENGIRSVVASGYGNDNYNSWKRHKMYGRIIIPYLNNCPLDFLSQKLFQYNVDYWEKHGFDVSKVVCVPDVFYKNKAEEKKKNINKEENVIQFPPNESK